MSAGAVPWLMALFRWWVCRPNKLSRLYRDELHIDGIRGAGYFLEEGYSIETHKELKESMLPNFIRIFPNVNLPPDAQLDDFIVLGRAPRGQEPGELALIVGAGCVIRSHSVIYAGNTIGSNFQTGHHVTIRELNFIGDNVSVGTHSVIEHHVQIGNGVRLHSRVFVPEYSILEDGCWLGPNVVVTNARYPLSQGAKEHLVGAHIEAGAMVGANSTLLPGVRLGARALVGAGSVVTKDVPPGMVVAGNPARVINSVDNIVDYRPR